MEQQLTGMNQTTFFMNCESLDDLNIRNTGYIIRPDGKVIIINAHEYHDVIISKYLSSYYHDVSFLSLDKIRAMIELGKINHIFFQGYPNSEQIKSRFGEVSVLFSLPDELSQLTVLQRKAMLNLLRSNFDENQKKFAEIQYYHISQLIKLLKRIEVSNCTESEILTALGIKFTEEGPKGYSFIKRRK